jgi:hypothetical protein
MENVYTKKKITNLDIFNKYSKDKQIAKDIVNNINQKLIFEINPKHGKPYFLLYMLKTHNHVNYTEIKEEIKNNGRIYKSCIDFSFITVDEKKIPSFYLLIQKENKTYKPITPSKQKERKVTCDISSITTNKIKTGLEKLAKEIDKDVIEHDLSSDVTYRGYNESNGEVVFEINKCFGLIDLKRLDLTVQQSALGIAKDLKDPINRIEIWFNLEKRDIHIHFFIGNINTKSKKRKMPGTFKKYSTVPRRKNNPYPMIPTATSIFTVQQHQQRQQQQQQQQPFQTPQYNMYPQNQQQQQQQQQKQQTMLPFFNTNQNKKYNSETFF